MSALYKRSPRQPDGGAAPPGYASQGGDPPRPYSGTPPPLDGADPFRTLREGPREAPRGPKTPKILKKRQKRVFTRFFGILALFGQKGLFCRDPTSPARGVLHQPLAPGPCTRISGLFWGSGGQAPKGPKKGVLGKFPRKRGKWGLEPRRGLADSRETRGGALSPAGEPRPGVPGSSGSPWLPGEGGTPAP